jgi:hypothetical protein
VVGSVFSSSLVRGGCSSPPTVPVGTIRVVDDCVSGLLVVVVVVVDVGVFL